MYNERNRSTEEAQISTEPDDDNLITRVRQGDTDAFAELVRRHAPIARRTAMLLGAGADADDVVQEALVKAYRALGRFRLGSPLRPWLLRIVANEARNLQRARRRRDNHEQRSALLSADLLAASAESADPASAALSTERQAELLTAVRMLSERHREVVTCRYLLDLDEAETATVLGWPRGTVKSRLHRALRKLRRELDTANNDRAKEVGHAHR